MRLQLSPLFVGQIMSIEHGEQLTPLTSQFAKGQTLPWIRVNEGDLTTGGIITTLAVAAASLDRAPSSAAPPGTGCASSHGRRRRPWRRIPVSVPHIIGSICQHGTALGGTARPA